MKPLVLLIDLPTLPKGTVGLSLPYLAGLLSDTCRVRIVDMNMMSEGQLMQTARTERPVMVGMKVSAQNHHLAENLTAELKTVWPGTAIVWGGEFPSLLPDVCAEHADCIVKGLFDIVAAEFVSDLLQGRLKKRYDGKNDVLPDSWAVPLWTGTDWPNGYNRFMGLPLETSRGCTESCTFCMVLVMQRKHYHTRPLVAIEADVKAIGRNHINIIDYNFGVSAEHVKQVCSIIQHSDALGFMAEMCIDLLDNDEVLEALHKARCRMIYCGLESIETTALRSVGKDRTNHIENYRGIIAKAHAKGIRVASGFILGMEGTHAKSYENALTFFREAGIMYVKLTFLTFNPGTRSKTFYEKKGRFLTDELRCFDGNHLTYLPEGVSEQETYAGLRLFVRSFYSLPSILHRAMTFPSGFSEKIEFILFNICYRQVYLEWRRNGMLCGNKMTDEMLNSPYRRPLGMRLAESLLLLLWKTRSPRNGK
ncbi:MAG: radical SAM protein [Flavobacteriales bacterium]|nr:radical SAM protein [Flavobacteriales bacterium]